MVAVTAQLGNVAIKSSTTRRAQVASFSIRAPLLTVRKQSLIARAAEAEQVAEEGITTADWAAERLAKLQAAEHIYAEEAAFTLNFLWLDKNIGVAVDQVFSKGQHSPVTEFFFWPRKDAWEELKATLEAKTWISEREKVLLLNKCTEVINYWQDENKHSAAEAQAKFSDCTFSGN